MSQTKPKRTTDFIHLYKPSFVGMAKIAMSFDTPSTAPGLTHIRWIHSHCCCRAYKILSYNSMCPVVWWANWVLQKQKKRHNEKCLFFRLKIEGKTTIGMMSERRMQTKKKNEKSKKRRESENYSRSFVVLLRKCSPAQRHWMRTSNQIDLKTKQFVCCLWRW